MQRIKSTFMTASLARVTTAACAVLLGTAVHAAAPGITSTNGSASATATTFNLQAAPGFINQPDGNQVYTWGYGCNETVPSTSFDPPTIDTSLVGCPVMQIPAPTLVVTEGQTVTVTLTNNLPAAAGNTSILFPGFTVTAAAAAAQPATGPCSAAPAKALVQGLLTSEVAHGCAVTYTFVASSPGTRAYYSGTQGDLQIEMGLYGAIIVLPAAIPAACTTPTGTAATNASAQTYWNEKDSRLLNANGLKGAAYDHGKTCYDREYLFQFSEMDPKVHNEAYAQVMAGVVNLQVATEPYHPGYFLINGRSMPDDMDGNYASQYPNQPYNGNPHMHPGEQVLLRVIGQGRWEHPFHEHANHVRILARDGNLLLSATSPLQNLAGLLMFTTDTFPGQSFDGLFYFTGRGLNWDMYAHNPNSTDPLAKLTCTPDANGYNTLGTSYTQVNYFEWCQDHNKPLEANPFGDVNMGGPMTLPNPNIFTNGAWYSGSPYLGPDATLRATSTLSTQGGSGAQTSSGCVTTTTTATAAAGANPTPYCTNLQPSNIQANPANERGWAFMWHSHNEREITTNNVFPGGMFMMMLVDSREFQIDEAN